MMWRRLAGLAAVAGMVAACAGAGTPSAGVAGATASPGAAPTGTPRPLQKVSVVLDFNLDATFAPMLWGIQQGYFAQQGIDLNILPSTGSNTAAAEIDAGKVDFAFTDMSSHILNKIQNKASTLGVMVWMDVPSFAIASLKPLNKPSDMIGTTWATVAFSSGRQTLPALLRQNGVDPSQVTIKLLDFSVLYQELFQGKIDSAETGIPGSGDKLKVQAQKLGKTLYYTTGASWGLVDYNKVLVTRQETIQSDPSLVQRMVTAMNMSLQNALKGGMSDADAFAVMKKADPTSDLQTVSLTWNDFKSVVHKPGPFDPTQVSTIFQRVVTDNSLKTTLQPSDLYTNQYVSAGS